MNLSAIFKEFFYWQHVDFDNAIDYKKIKAIKW